MSRLPLCNMAIYTKLDQKIVQLRIDPACYFDGKLLKVWARVEDATEDRQLFISDLKGDHGKEEVQSVIRATIKNQSAH